MLPPPARHPGRHCLTLNLSARRLRAVAGRNPKGLSGIAEPKEKGEARSGSTDAGRGTSRRLGSSTHPRLRDRLGFKTKQDAPSSQLPPSTTLAGSVVCGLVPPTTTSSDQLRPAHAHGSTRQVVRDPLPNGFASIRRLSSAAPVGSWRLLASRDPLPTGRTLGGPWRHQQGQLARPAASRSG